MSGQRQIKIEVRDGKVFLDGEEQSLEIEAVKTLHVRVTGLSRFSSLDRYAGTATRRTQIRGHGAIDDTVQVLGLSARTDKLEVSIQAAPPSEASEARIEWRSDLGWLAADWETRSAECWYLQCYVPAETFSELDQEYREGRLQVLSLGVRAAMWAPWSPFPHAERTPWHLLPGKHGTSAHVVGELGAINWGDQLPTEGPKAGHQHSHTTDTDDRLLQRTAEAPRSSARAIRDALTPYMWGMITVICLLVIIAVRSG
ncbi:hypothetical protein GCM10007301_47940 [Azorhizobium oxalatiphilum]|uniref:Uncharacterized protein n=1 Tax=Azorhizobium oxalatiphilum TaxID=980631 RepID=A0A917CAR3_9HYPH|nr:hypothetical protein [Azorhizobium oxalatiphilum]GGF82257.1 hypothetical protein GCM10007301_47940 [Azorhizobium oxalatiphilum]